MQIKWMQGKSASQFFFLWDIESAAIQKHWNCLLNHGENIYHKRELSFKNFIFFKLKITWSSQSLKIGIDENR